MSVGSPEESAAATRRQLGVSGVVLAINVAVYVLMVLADLRSGAAAVMAGPSDAVFLEFGGLYVPSIAEGEWWRLVTPNFIHLGIVHLLFNCIALQQIGPQVEAIYGARKLISLYVAMGVLSSVCSYAFGINGAGASGAIFGLIGVMAVHGWRIGGPTGRALMQQMLTWAAFSVIATLGIGNQAAHVGGFVSGAAFALVIEAAPPVMTRAARAWTVAAICSAALVVVSFGMVAAHYG